MPDSPSGSRYDPCGRVAFHWHVRDVLDHHHQPALWNLAQPELSARDCGGQVQSAGV